MSETCKKQEDSCELEKRTLMNTLSKECAKEDEKQQFWESENDALNREIKKLSEQCASTYVELRKEIERQESHKHWLCGFTVTQAAFFVNSVDDV